MTVVTPKFGMGASVLRREDQAFLKGEGRYTDDIKPAGLLHGYVLRSPVAKAGFTITSTEAASAAPGVHLVLTGKDIAHLGKLKSGVMQRQPDGTRAPTRDIPILCGDRVNYVGDAVAFVVADSRALAQDAAELIEVDYDSEDAASGTATALDEGTPLVWPELGSNRAFTYHIGDKQKTAAAFARAAHITRIEFINNRLVCNYMEPRSAIGEWNVAESRFVLTTGSQGVHSMQYIIAELFKIKKSELRIITPDVGGGFGPKAFVYREYPLVLEAAKRLGRPVKWAGDRTEHFLTDAQGRDNVVKAEMALDKGGRFLGMKVELLANIGAYVSQYGPFIPYVGVTMSTGVYDIGAIDVSVTGLYTNTCPVDAYRGAGRPEAALLLEKLVDACAHDLGLPVEDIRRRNFIRPEQFPYRTQTGRLYDTGEFAGHMDRAIERAEWKAFPQRLEQSKAAGRIRGIGMATYIEACAFPGSEPAFVELNGDGTVTLKIGTQTNGQGHATAYAQFLSDKLDLPIDRIQVRQGDTDDLKDGGGTGGSRSIPLGGVSASRAGEDLANKIKRIAADELEASAGDIELSDGVARIVGTDRTIDFASVARAAKTADDLKGFGEFVQDECTYPNGTHICEVEIDPDTGATEILRYTIVDDFGVTVNPILLAGQVHGGVVQGIGQALTENTVYSEDGQLLTASFMDYAMPRADSFPFFHFETRNVPSTTNALGIKGAGEAGTIGATPAALNAVTDALWRAHGIRHIEMPATPARIWTAIRDASPR
ncbi:xanthine dehydrogenase family protein molybdopterin-binding subunit [Mesorhizobium sp. M4B.F.Ca.ET.190.01.1.1]|uniref:xanthine dehydrogenase family protein molybdopterin-binding subunit n=4 Tax=Mesorhizobium TaxID=68287 RepID=UPI000FE59524|nr:MULTISPECIES: xanthine dehydrogenase family protein molybdopterin-binding subunit [unclassified Mesorhizobium]RWF62934.1 MAG: xanthine dehydrogenase family protein molybdopterin-binding subunit [Mesorhizobium sp.]TGQ43543.1 xanthine dehydrogenase family protein molybdopterin-binding subunit [Mesorhizobium sp. M4B.F.Ca.ET.214.01.1.1]TGQ62358.1 xanthine dehydrogenase family protein molybdopterin-binding subunit [Mesorhizobium sp. M4B.F.Ca.ET.211.01.1.1]TGR14999.1 xanthine dehydrogenase family 